MHGHDVKWCKSDGPQMHQGQLAKELCTTKTMAHVTVASKYMASMHAGAALTVRTASGTAASTAPGMGASMSWMAHVHSLNCREPSEARANGLLAGMELPLWRTTKS